MQQGNQEQHTDEEAMRMERVRLYLEQQHQPAQEQRNSEEAWSAERMRLHLEQQQREEANVEEARQQPPASNAVPPFNPQELQVDEALSYVSEVETTYIDRPHVFEQFLDTLKKLRFNILDTAGALERIRQLFNENPRLIDGFNRFLPPTYQTFM